MSTVTVSFVLPVPLQTVYSLRQLRQVLLLLLKLTQARTWDYTFSMWRMVTHISFRVDVVITLLT